MADYTVHLGDCIESMKQMPDACVNTCVTSPPYFGLRDYGHDGQIGLEPTPDEFVSALVAVFREVKRVLRDDGTLWLNIGDSYAGSGKGRNADGTHQEGGKQGTNKGTIVGALLKTTVPDCKPKDLIGIPWMLAFALRADGWYLRQDIIWHKPNPMPESVRDRCTKAHEYIFLLSKSPKYFFDAEAMKEPALWAHDKRAGKGRHIYDGKRQGGEGEGQEAFVSISETRNRRSVWSVATRPYKGAHFATFPPDLIEPCILAGCPEGGTVLDPFGGSGTTAGVALKHNRNAVLCELSPEYAKLIPDRIKSICEIQKPKKQRKFTPEEQQLLL
jgi:DNA modification methylase